jgi:hypothetical protein
MIEVHPIGKYDILGRGLVMIIDLVNDKLPTLKEDVWTLFLGKHVIVAEQVYKVYGIEAFATPLNTPIYSVGLLVKKEEEALL